MDHPREQMLQFPKMRDPNVVVTMFWRSRSAALLPIQNIQAQVSIALGLGSAGFSLSEQGTSLGY
jgi:hypothetical protein